MGVEIKVFDIIFHFQKKDDKKKIKNLEHGIEKAPVIEERTTKEENDESVKIKDTSPLVDKLNTNAIPTDTSELRGWFVRLFGTLRFLLQKCFSYS